MRWQDLNISQTKIGAALLFLLPIFNAHAQTTQIKNFRKVAPGVFAGANPIDGNTGDLAFQYLIKIGVKTVIDLQGNDVTEAPNLGVGLWNEIFEPGEQEGMVAREKNVAKAARMTFVNFQINSNKPVSDKEGRKIDAALDILSNATRARPVYLHCEHGADRTGLVVALFRVLKQGQNIDDANAEWVKFGHGSISKLFTHDLDDYFCARVRKLASSVVCGSKN
jgi:protein-tyrosine phosphatase